jgi:hypothetical protein
MAFSKSTWNSSRPSSCPDQKQEKPGLSQALFQFEVDSPGGLGLSLGAEPKNYNWNTVGSAVSSGWSVDMSSLAEGVVREERAKQQK